MATFRKKLTEQYIDKIKAPLSGQDEHFDALLGGLAVRVGKSGKKTFTLLYRVKGSPKVRRMTIGPYVPNTEALKNARKKARKALEEAQEGRNPKPNPTGRISFKDLAADYIERHAKQHKRSWKQDERTLKKHFSTWGDLFADAITSDDVFQIIDELAAKTPYQANRALATIRKLFNWAVDKRKLKASPVAGIKPPGRETARERVLNDDEIKALWEAWQQTGWPFGDCHKLMLITGQRKNEVAGMRWADLDLKAGLWTLPASATKSKRRHICPLPQMAIDLIKNQPRISDSEFVFTTTGLTPISGFSKAKRGFDKIAKVADWRAQDLRRTCATKLASLGKGAIVPHVLNHAPQGVTRRHYDMYEYLPEKREALDLWAAKLKGIIEDENIVKALHAS